jgi:hypothetical protein
MCGVPHPGDPAWPMIFELRLKDLREKRQKLFEGIKIAEVRSWATSSK